MGKALYLWTVEIFIVYLISFCINSSHGFQRVERSVKTTYPKDISRFRASVMEGMQNKINILEASVGNMDARMKAIDVTNKGLEKSLKEQKVMLEKLDEDFNSVRRLVATHGSSMDELKLMAYPDEDAFIISNETCGGVLHAQSGFAIYTSKVQGQSILEYLRSSSYSYSSWLASTCVWTIQANHRSLIKFTTKLLDLPYNSRAEHPSGAYALEGIGSNVEDTTFQPPRVTKLIRGVTYKFKGPLLYIVLYFPDNTRISSLNTFSFQFDYEGEGRRVQRNTFFSHKLLDVHSSKRGEFTDKDCETPPVLDLDSSWNETSTSPELSFTSIVLSNFTTMIRLGTVLGKESCSNDTFMRILTLSDILFGDNNTIGLNLCESGDGKQLITSYAQPFMILIGKPLAHKLSFNLSWISETEYPPMYISIGNESNLQQTTCGSVLGGSSGYIAFKRENKYRNGERCVWVISPQPAPRTSIDISFTQDTTVGSHNSREASNNDHVYIIEFTNIDGDEREDGPKVTTLSALYTTPYKARSREAYVVFYSDSSVTSNGFLVRWEASGDMLGNRSDVATRYNFISQRNGTMELITRDSSFFNILNQVFIFIPNLPSTLDFIPDYVFGLDLQLNQTEGVTSLVEPSGDDFTCMQERFEMFAVSVSDSGYLEKRNNTGCLNPGDALIKNADGMVILFVKNSAANENLNNVSFNFSWKQDGGDDIVKMENGKCGGVIIGNRGILRYKLEQKYNRNEHCLWLLQSPNSTSITLKLMKEGFGTGDHLIVNSIDADAGLLRNDAVQLRIPFHKMHTFNDSLLVISFRPSSTNLNGTGFLLQFWSSLETEDQDDSEDTDRESSQNSDDKIDYRLRHSELHSGRFLYESSSQNSHSPGEQLHVIGFSTSTIANVAARPKITTVNWTYGVFKKSNDSCTYDSIRFYSTLVGNGANSLGGLWQQNVVFPEGHFTESCPNQVKIANSSTILTANYSAFLVIYKLVAYPLEIDSGGDERKIDFTHVQTQSPAKLEEERDEDTYSYRNPLYRSYLDRYLRSRYYGNGSTYGGGGWSSYGLK